MGPEMTGVLVNKINPLSDAYDIMKKDDIILAFDGEPIANDGTGILCSFHSRLSLLLLFFFFFFPSPNLELLPFSL